MKALEKNVYLQYDPGVYNQFLFCLVYMYTFICMVCGHVRGKCQGGNKEDSKVCFLVGYLCTFNRICSLCRAIWLLLEEMA